MTDDADPRPFDARFRILRELGQGALGRVVLAHDVEAQREVAIKLVHPHAAAERGAERLRREGELLASLRHPGIVAVHSAGLWQGSPYLVMDYVEGARQLDAVPDASREQRLDWLLEAARALAYVHAQGLVHRDLKPANVLLDAAGRVRVCDFGLAWTAHSQRLTQTGRYAGTPAYMAPEQFEGSREGQSFDPRTDVWALGAMLYEVLTGQLPFNQPTLLDHMAQVLAEPPTPPRALDVAVSPALEAVCLRALAKLPAERQSDAGAFAADLEAARADTRPSRRGPHALGAVVACALVGGLAWWALGSGTDRAGGPDAGVAHADREPAAAPNGDAELPDVAESPAVAEHAGDAPGAASDAGFAAQLRAVRPPRRLAFAWAWSVDHPDHPDAAAARDVVARAGPDAARWQVDTDGAPPGVVFRGERALVTFTARDTWAWELEPGGPTRSGKIVHGEIGEVLPLPNGQLVLTRSTGDVHRISCYAAAADGWTRVWIKGSPRVHAHLSAAADGGLLAHAFLDDPGRRLVWLLEPSAGERLARLGGRSPGPVRGLVLTRDGERALLLEAGELSEWDLTARGQTAELRTPARVVAVDPLAHALTLAPSGAWLALNAPQGALLLDARTLEPRGRVGAAPEGTRTLLNLSHPLAFDARGEVLARVAGDTLELWRTADLRPLRPTIRLPALAQGVSVSPDGRLVAVGLADSTCRVWPSQIP